MGSIHLLRRPFLTTGTRDVAALGVAVSGFMVAGPMELFLPQSAAYRFGVFAWLLMLVFYALCLLLTLLLLRPRLVVYNGSPAHVRPVLDEVLPELDAQAMWVGDTLVAPTLGVQLHLESFGAMRSTQLVASGPRQSPAGWRRLERALLPGLRAQRTSGNPQGLALVAMGLIMIGVVAVRAFQDPTTMVQALDEMLRR